MQHFNLVWKVHLNIILMQFLKVSWVDARSNFKISSNRFNQDNNKTKFIIRALFQSFDTLQILITSLTLKYQFQNVVAMYSSKFSHKEFKLHFGIFDKTLAVIILCKCWICKCNIYFWMSLCYPLLNNC